MPLFGQEHVDRYLATDGQEGHDWQGTQTLLLTTTGRRTGRARTVPLLYVGDGVRMVVIASNWGGPRHPAWALNLEANPATRVSVAGVERAYTARHATSEERERYWAQAVRVWPGYDDYRARARREIRVFVLEPVELERSSNVS